MCPLVLHYMSLWRESHLHARAHSVLKEREIIKHSVLKERVLTQLAKPEWQLVPGKRGRKGSRGVFHRSVPTVLLCRSAGRGGG
eukprot:3845298-Amphidinium_carterae.1